MRQRAKQNNGKKKISGLIFVLVFFVLIISFVQAVGADKKDGFFWIGNNSYENGDKGEATIGMIKVSGSDYGLTIEQEKENKAIIDGRAWMGIGFLDDKVNDFTDQKDHPSLGWIKFNQSTPTDCGEMLNKDCNPATWHRKTGAPTGSMEGYLSGWAKVELGKNGDGENYPETWVYFKPPVDKSGFSCTKNENLVRRTKDYYACTDNEGYLFGYAWSSELKALTLKDNSGLGWINFNLSFNNCEENGICNKNCSADPDCLCTVTKNFPTSDSIKPNEPVEYKATIKDSAPITPISYQWFCDKTTEISDIHTVTDKTDINICKDYVQPERIYEPKVIFNYKEGTETKSTTCMNNGVKVKVSPPVPLPPDPCQENGVCNLECEEGKDPDCLCRVRKLSPQDDFITPNSPVKYQAKAEGPITPINYQWFCDKNATNDFKNHPSSSMVDEHTCDGYSILNYAYEPKVTLTYKEGGETKQGDCTNDGIIPIKPISFGSCFWTRKEPVSGKINLGTPVKFLLAVSGNLPGKIEYDCGDGFFSPGNNTLESQSITCSIYNDPEKTYISKARMKYGDGDYILCNPETVEIQTGGVSDSCSCNVMLKLADTTGEEHNRWSDSIKINKISTEIAGKVERVGGGCDTTKNPIFNIPGSKDINYTDGGNQVKFFLKEDAFDSAVSAKIKNKSGNDVECRSAFFEISQSIRIR